MKKFLLGLTCGITLTATTAVYASDSIQAYLFPAKIEINGQSKELVWRYDISAKSNYKFMDSGQGYNIDFNALEKVDLGAQLFISWSDEGRIMLIDLDTIQVNAHGMRS
jgi:hypothetical protein